jgi:transcription antitermination factor NusG
VLEEIRRRTDMADFKIGDTVKITAAAMTGNVGTVVSIDEKREKFLVRTSDVTQNYFTADELELFRAH